jgi:Dolichyl-phosphate-mannose-protein mannosyltransferase
VGRCWLACEHRIASDFRSWLLRFIDSIPSFIERNERVFLACFTVFYFVGSIANVYLRPLWYDELYTLYLAQLATSRQVWRALHAGVDVAPPLFHLMTRWSTHLLGISEIGVRTPAIVGFWVFCMSVYAFVRRRASAMYAVIAMFIPFLTIAARFIVEARPYGLMLAFCGLSLVFWQAAADQTRRVRSLVGLAASLLGAASVHYYGVVIALPLVVGEIVRSIGRRHIDWRMAFVLLAAPTAVLATHLSFIRAAMIYSGGAWAETTLPSLIGTYKLLVTAPKGLALIWIGVLLFCSVIVGFRPGKSCEKSDLPPHEKIAVGAFLSVPLITFMIALFTNRIFAPRYSLVTVTALAVIGPWIVARIRRYWSITAPVCLLVLSSWFFNSQVQAVNYALGPRFYSGLEHLRQLAEGSAETIVISDPQKFLELRHYSPPALAKRLRYIADHKLARRYNRSDDDDKNLLLLELFKRLGVATRSEFFAANDPFLIFTKGDGWLMLWLEDNRVPMVKIGIKDEDQLWLVPSRKAAHSPLL